MPRKRPHVLTASIAMIALLAASSTGLESQVPLERTSDHERINFFVGEWKVVGTITAFADGAWKKVDLTGTFTCEWVLEDKWMIMKNSDTFAGKTHDHISLATWDPNEEKYFRRVFTGSSVIHPLESGRWIDAKTFEFAGEFAWDDGNTYGFKNVYEIVSESELKYTMHQSRNGDEYSVRMEAMLEKS